MVEGPAARASYYTRYPAVSGTPSDFLAPNGSSRNIESNMYQVSSDGSGSNIINKTSPRTTTLAAQRIDRYLLHIIGITA